MAKDRMTLLDILRKAGVEKDVDFLREGVKTLAEAIMELRSRRRLAPHCTSIV